MRGKSKGKKNGKKPVQFEKEEESIEQNANDGPRDYFSLKMKANAQNKKQKQTERDEDPICLLQNYTNENYKKHIEIIKGYIENQKPFQHHDPELERFIQLGANICFYGYGSKRKLLMEVAKKYFSDHYIWEINGYLTTIHVKKIFNNFGTLLKRAGMTDSIDKITLKDQLEEYRSILENNHERGKKPLVIVFHCLDGSQLMSVDAQDNLSKLLSLPSIRVLCSIDNMKISTVWHPKVKQAYKFIYYQISTKIPNIEEQIYKPVSTERTYQVEQSLMNICQSLNSNQKKILKILAKNQLQNLNREHRINYTVTQLLEVCIDEVILSSDIQLKENLIELLDHGVLLQKMDDTKNRKVLCMKYEKKLLEKLLDLRID